MKVRQVIASAKTILLLLLVIASLVLSYNLWMGFWGRTTNDIGTEVLPTPSSTEPTTQQAEVPMRLVIHTASSKVSELSFPGSTLFNLAMQLVSSANVFNFHEYPPGTESRNDTLSLDFGYTLTRQQILQVVPTLKTYSVGFNSSQLVLNENPESGLVSLIIPTTDSDLWFGTNLSPSQLKPLFDHAAKQPGWQSLDDPAGSYVPSDDFTMDRSTWETRSVQQMSLTRSFFVNPLALTSLSGEGQSNVWTDGSRIVWWNQPIGEMTYQDPNASGSNASNMSALDMALSFIRAHGGCPSNAVAITEPEGPLTIESGTFIMRSSVDGFPIVDGSQDYRVQFEYGQITEYIRPIWELGPNLSSQSVRVLGYQKLTAALTKLSPGFNWQQTDVELGYASHVNNDGTVTFEPAYVVSSGGITLWTLSAVTGKPIEGLSAP